MQRACSSPSCHLAGQKPSSCCSPYSFLYGKRRTKGVKDGNYLIGLLTNNSPSVAVWQWFSGEVKGHMLHCPIHKAFGGLRERERIFPENFPHKRRAPGGRLLPQPRAAAPRHVTHRRVTPGHVSPTWRPPASRTAPPCASYGGVRPWEGPSGVEVGGEGREVKKQDEGGEDAG